MTSRPLLLWTFPFAIFILAGFGSPGLDYRFPLSLDPVLLSGTFGELRPNHFHSGLDIKTNGTSGLPILAVEEGYVYRVKVSTIGYGKAVYLRHPDGHFTVYAHLDSFSPEIDAFVYQKQAASRQFEQELYLPTHRISVRRGDIIGFSGNTGSSGGPHLHFEIRDRDDRILDPILQYRNLIQDNVPPLLNQIAFQPLRADSRVNGRWEKLWLEPKLVSPGQYEIPGIIELNGQVGVEYQAWDLLSGAPNPCGVNFSRLYLDDQLIFEYGLDRFSFDEKRYINVHQDYRVLIREGKRLQRAYLANGNALGAYQNLQNRGILSLLDDAQHRLRLELADAYGNTTLLRGLVRRGTAPPPAVPQSLKGGSTLSYSIDHNVLKVLVRNPEPGHLQGIKLELSGGIERTLLPAWAQPDALGYTFQLHADSLPKTLLDPITQQSIPFFFRQTVYPNKDQLVAGPGPQMFFPYGALFDTLYLSMRPSPKSAGLSQDWEVGDPDVPLFRPILLRMEPAPSLPPAHQVVAFRALGDSRWEFVGSEILADGRIQAAVQEFGTFALMADSTPPTAKPLNFSPGKAVPASLSTLRLSIADNFSGINPARTLATLDGEWILAEYDPKSGGLALQLRNRPAPGLHLLELNLQDQANNLYRQQFSLQF